MTLSAIEEKVKELGDRIGVPPTLYPTYGQSADGARPHIETDDAGNLHFVVVERGREVERQTTTTLDELLYWVFDAITFSMACSFELANRNHTQDFRRLLFSKQEALLECLNMGWQQKKRDQHNLILARHPFTDGVFNA